MVSGVFSLFSLQVLNVLDLEVRGSGYLHNWIFWSYCRLGISKMQEFVHVRILKEIING